MAVKRPAKTKAPPVPEGVVDDETRDNRAVDAFADALKAKLAVSRSKGRSGWQTCPKSMLWKMLREHVEKGDPVDVGALAMMVHLTENHEEPPPRPDDEQMAVLRELLRYGFIANTAMRMRKETWRALESVHDAGWVTKGSPGSYELTELGRMFASEVAPPVSMREAIENGRQQG